MPPAPVPLGPYDLRVPIGRGGMAVVWRAVYRPLGQAVAVKVLTPEAAARSELIACFAREVRTAAALDHPNIAAILDASEVDPEASAASGGRLVAGSPYLVTELAFGSLAGASPPSSWREVRRLVSALLAALAYAHARGVTHRDLKPGNVLIAAPPRDPAQDPALPLEVGSLEGRQEPRVLLSDFGLASTWGELGADTESASGTPAYMAPEQFFGQRRDIGPWTDLYALGCLTWWLVAGRTPFQPRTLEQAMLHHQHRALPPLRPLFPVPDGLEGWLFRMLARDPMARFSLAADADLGLSRLGDAHPGAPVTGVEDSYSDADITQPVAAGADEQAATHAAPPPPLTPLCPRIAPPLPALDMLRRDRVSARLRGAGTALTALRDPPLIGADVEQAALWDALAAVHRDRLARAVVVRGPAGARTERLGRWLAVTAHEVGAARWMGVSFDRADPRVGLGGAVGFHLGMESLAPAEALARVEAWLTARGHADPLAGPVVLDLALQRPAQGEHASLSSAHFAAFRLVLRLAAEDRPLVLWLDGRGGASDAVCALGGLLAGRLAAPVLMVLSLDEDADAWTAAAREGMTLLLARRDVLDLRAGAANDGLYEQGYGEEAASA